MLLVSLSLSHSLVVVWGMNLVTPVCLERVRVVNDTWNSVEPALILFALQISMNKSYVTCDGSSIFPVEAPSAHFVTTLGPGRSSVSKIEPLVGPKRVLIKGLQLAPKEMRSPSYHLPMYRGSQVGSPQVQCSRPPPPHPARPSLRSPCCPWSHARQACRPAPEKIPKSREADRLENQLTAGKSWFSSLRWNFFWLV